MPHQVKSRCVCYVFGKVKPDTSVNQKAEVGTTTNFVPSVLCGTWLWFLDICVVSARIGTGPQQHGGTVTTVDIYGYNNTMGTEWSPLARVRTITL